MRVRATLLLALSVFIAIGGTGCSEQISSEEPAAEEQTPLAQEESPRTSAQSGSVRQRVKDVSLATKIRIALAEEQGLGRYDFSPQVQDGRVALQGDVETNAQRERAAEVVAEVEGVEAISNQITIGGQPVVAEQQTPELDSEEATEDEPAVADVPDETTEEQEPDPEEEVQAEEPEEPEASEEEPAEEESSEEYYVVQSGDNLWSIARRHDTSVSQLRQLNNLSSDNLQPGDRLRVR